MPRRYSLSECVADYRTRNRKHAQSREPLSPTSHKKELVDSFKPLFVDALEQILSREAIQLGRLLRGADNPAAVIETFYTDGSDIQVFIARKVEPVITALLGNLGVEAGKVASEVAIFTENHIETSEDILQAGRNLALLETFEGQAEARASGYLTAILGRLRGNDDV